MNKSLLLLALCLVIITSFFTKAFSQCIPDTTVQVGFMPDDSLDCFVNGKPTDQTIYFGNYWQTPGLTVYRLRIDSLLNLPCGSGYALNKCSRIYLTGESGCIQITGIPDDTPGRYRLRTIFSVDLDADTSDWNFERVESCIVMSLFVNEECGSFVRLKDHTNDTCPMVDSFAIDLTASCKTMDNTCNVGLIGPGLDVIEVSPNPNDGIFTIKLNQASGAVESLEVLDLVGRPVYKENSVRGPVTKVIDLQDQPEGIYILRLVGERSINSKRIIILGKK